MPGAPYFSVVMPVFNGQAFLRRSIESVQRQSDADWELIAVDDGSTDGSRDLLERMCRAEPRIKVVAGDASGGPARPRNFGLAAARGEVACFIDQDDEWSAAKLARQRATLESGQYGVVYGDCWVQGLAAEPFRYSERWGPAREGAVLPALIEQDFVPALTIAVPMSVVRAVGDLDETLPGVDDYDYLLRIAFAGYDFGVVDEPIATWHLGEHNFSRQQARQQEQLLRCLRKHQSRDPRYAAVFQQRIEEARRQLFRERLDHFVREPRAEREAATRAMTAAAAIRRPREAMSWLAALARRPTR
jgi:glycosyltransferase involved in cell wall biosynthesis